MAETDLTAVNALTFEVPRESVIKLIDAKLAFLKKLVAAWQAVPNDEAYLDVQTAEEKAKAVAAAKAQGMPAEMAPPPPKRIALIAMAKKNARNFSVAMIHWQTQKKFLSKRDVFTLTQEQLMNLSADHVDNLFPPVWPGVTDCDNVDAVYPPI